MSRYGGLATLLLLAIPNLWCDTLSAQTQPEAFYETGLALIDSGYVDEAFTLFQQALENDSRDPYAYIGLGVLEEAREPGSHSAGKYFDKAIRVDRTCAEAYYRFGIHFTHVKKHLFEARHMS